jgi:hypothetical protein
MRLVKSLFMLLMLVTFSTGFGYSTTDLKQNSKTEIVGIDLVKAIAVSSVEVVTFDCNSLYSETIFISDKNITAIVTKPDCETYYAIIKDVGWRYSSRYNKQLVNKEKLLSLKYLYHKNKNQLKTNRIRDDNTFNNSLPFYITNRAI